jgi:sortase A
MFVVGTGREQLAKGPGLYPGTSFPGAAGVAAIAGHRTTFGAPFYDLNQVRALGDPQSSRDDGRGDSIVVETLAGTQTFEVIATRIVQPDETWVAAPIDQPIDSSAPQTSNNWATVLTEQWIAWGVDEQIEPGDAYLVLTTCNPRYSAAERLVVLGRVGADDTVEVTFPGGRHDIDELPGIDGDTSSADALSGDAASAPPALLWGGATLAVGLLWWWCYRRWRHPLTWFAGVVPFLAVLAGFYVYLERLLPSTY